MIFTSLVYTITDKREKKKDLLVQKKRCHLQNVQNTLVEPAEEEVSACDLANITKYDTIGCDIDEENIVECINCSANDAEF